MPVSRNGRMYFTKAQLEAARRCSALEYAQRVGYALVRDGSNAFHLREHDSMIFTRDGKWFWNSRGLRGRAIEFLLFYEGRSLPDAVNILTAGSGDQYKPIVKPNIQPQQPFELPEKSPTFKRLFGYLCGTRKLDPDIVQMLVKEHRVYEGIHRYPVPETGEAKEAHNVVFVAMDEAGIPRGAFQRGTNTYGGAYKGDVPGSDKKYAFCCPGKAEVTTVSVFEASIDAISHATIAKMDGHDWRDRDRIALGGLAAAPLLHYLEHHPTVKQIEFCLDQDVWGLAATERLIRTLEENGYSAAHGYHVFQSTVNFAAGKDWNEELVFRVNSI